MGRKGLVQPVCVVVVIMVWAWDFVSAFCLVCLMGNLKSLPLLLMFAIRKVNLLPFYSKAKE